MFYYSLKNAHGAAVTGLECGTIIIISVIVIMTVVAVVVEAARIRLQINSHCFRTEKLSFDTSLQREIATGKEKKQGAKSSFGRTLHRTGRRGAARRDRISSDRIGSSLFSHSRLLTAFSRVRVNTYMYRQTLRAVQLSRFRDSRSAQSNSSQLLSGLLREETSLFSPAASDSMSAWKSYENMVQQNSMQTVLAPSLARSQSTSGDRIRLSVCLS